MSEEQDCEHKDPLRVLLRGRIRRTRRIHLGEVPADVSPRTQIGGKPWWPRAVPRPHCARGHAMAFMAQVLLSDVPELAGDTSLLSFHYCVECEYAGNMSFGANDLWGNRGYSVDLLSMPVGEADGLGVVVPSPLPSNDVGFSEADEIPALEDLAEHEVDALPPGFPAKNDDFDERVWPGLVHVARSKLGGWPSWVQWAEWPDCMHGRRMVFVGQFDWELGQHASWAGGGYAYLFACASACSNRLGELVIQTS